MKEFNRRELFKLAAKSLSAAALAPWTGCGSRQETLNIFNWFNYIGQRTIPSFEKETNIKVNQALFASEDEMFSKLKAGVRGFDLVVATDYMIPRMKALQLIDPIPTGMLANLKNIGKRFQDPIYDPGLQYSIPYLWGTTGIGFNKDKLQAPPRAWRDLWDERYRGRISMLDNARDAIGCALLILGLPADTKDPAHLGRAKELLLRQRPLLKQYSSSTYTDDLTSGELWLAQGWSGDVLQASRENKQIDYVIPEEGSFLYVDSLCLVRGSRNRAAAMRFIDHVLRPEIAADICNTVRYATPNEAARPSLDAAIRQDPRIYPTNAVEARLRFAPPLDAESDEAWNQLWQDVKVI